MQIEDHDRLSLASEYFNALLINPRSVVRFEARFFMISTHNQENYGLPYYLPYNSEIV